MQRSGEAGFGVIQAIVALALVGIFGAVLSTMSSNDLQAVNLVRERSDLEDLRRFIRVARSCTRTVAATPCSAAGQPVAFLRADGAVLVKADAPEQVGKWLVTATCKGTNNEYSVRVKRLKEPVSKYRELFVKNPDRC